VAVPPAVATSAGAPGAPGATGIGRGAALFTGTDELLLVLGIRRTDHTSNAPETQPKLSLFSQRPKVESPGTAEAIATCDYEHQSY